MYFTMSCVSADCLGKGEERPSWLCLSLLKRACQMKWQRTDGRWESKVTTDPQIGHRGAAAVAEERVSGLPKAGYLTRDATRNVATGFFAVSRRTMHVRSSNIVRKL